MARSLAGTRIRERRRRLGLSQTALAKEAGISPSYLNLIEHNRRSVAGRVLLSLAGALQTTPSALSEDIDAAQLAELRQAAALLPEREAELAQIEEFVGRMPGWAGLLAALYRRTRDQEAAIAALSDRLTHDPYFGETVHAMVSSITAVRSSAAILTQMDRLAPDDRQGFLSAIHEESLRLSAVAEGLAAYFDEVAETSPGTATPEEAIDRFLDHHNHRFPSLDAAVADPNPEAAIGQARDALLAAAPSALQGSVAPRLRRALDVYASDAVGMPLRPFAEAAWQLDFDPARLAERFAQPLHAVFRRLATLRRPGFPAPAMGMVAVTASGYPLYRVPLAAFPVPRHGNACPLWPLFQAFATPERPVAARLEHDAGAVFTAFAVAEKRAPAGFDAPPDYISAMLIVEREGQPQTLAAGPSLAVGTACRICTRTRCPARAEAGVMGRAG